MSDYYDHTTYPVTNSAGSSASMRAELDAIEAAFDKLPTITANGGKMIRVNAGATALEATDAPTFAGAVTVQGAFTSLGLDDNATAKALTLSGSGANSVTIANSATNPTIGVSAGALNITSALGVGSSVPAGIQLSSLSASNGTVAARVANLGVAPVVDLLQTAVDVAAGTGYFHYRAYSLLSTVPTPVFSIRGDGLTTIGLTTQNTITLAGSATNPTIGTSAGNLVVATAGQTSAIFSAPVTTENYIRFEARATAGNAPIIWFEGGATNINAEFRTKGTGAFRFITDGGVATSTQVLIDHTASANRCITLTGSNGGNPTIGTSAGMLKINCGLAISSSYAVTGATDTILDTMYMVTVNYAGTCALTLPNPASYVGRILRILTYSANAVVSASANVVSLTLGAASTAILPATAGKWCDMMSDGTNWRITAAN